MRGAATGILFGCVIVSISTHAPHARRGTSDEWKVKEEINFYSRASCEARLCTMFATTSLFQSFLLTRLMRGAAHIAILGILVARNFYSRASCEARQKGSCVLLIINRFLLTRLMRGAAVSPSGRFRKSTTFLLTRLMRGAAMGRTSQRFIQHRFLLTRLMRGAASSPSYAASMCAISTHAPHARRGGCNARGNSSA